MKIVLIIRRNKEYYLDNNINLDKILRNPLWKQSVQNMIKTWNFCFNMKYIDFRIKLRNIAFRTFEKNDFDEIIPYFNMKKYNTLKKGTLVIPIDEDDWLSPNLTKTLRKIKEPFEKVYWDITYKTTKFEPESQTLKNNNSNYTYSCAYGIKVPHPFVVLKWHYYFKKEKAYYIPKVLACKHTNIASLSTFHDMAKQKNTLIDLINFAKYQISNPTIYSKEFKKEGNLYKKLLQELIDSCKLRSI